MSESKETDNSVKCDVNVDKVLRELGQAGQFHLRTYMLVALAAVQVGLLHTTYIFLAGDVKYSVLLPLFVLYFFALPYFYYYLYQSQKQLKIQ